MTQSATKRVYLAGPMTGYQQWNFPAFHKYAKQLRDAGYLVFSPAENDVLILGVDPLTTEGAINQLTYKQVMEDDTRWICRYADAIALMPGWEASRGVKVEKALAELLGLEVIELAA